MSQGIKKRKALHTVLGKDPRRLWAQDPMHNLLRRCCQNEQAPTTFVFEFFASVCKFHEERSVGLDLEGQKPLVAVAESLCSLNSSGWGHMTNTGQWIVEEAMYVTSTMRQLRAGMPPPSFPRP